MTDHRVSTISSLPPVGSSTTVSRSAVSYRLGGRTYPLRSEPKCKVCQSPYRLEIERSLIKSYGPTAVYRSLPPQAQSDLTVRNISDHARLHLPVDQTIRQAAMEARARELGTTFEDAEGALVDHIVFAKVGLQRVYERMASGEIEPSVTDGIAFAQMLLKIDEKAGEGIDQEMMARGFMVYVRAMQQVCTPDQIQQMSAIIQSDPLMKSLLSMGQRAETIEGAVQG